MSSCSFWGAPLEACMGLKMGWGVSSGGRCSLIFVSRLLPGEDCAGWVTDAGSRSTALLVVVTFSYSVISPIINGLAFALFFLLFMLYKYLFLYVYDQPASGDTGGLFFPKAITHVFVGLYVEQICLAALFFLAQKPDKTPSAIPEGALMIVLIVITVSSALSSSSEILGDSSDIISLARLSYHLARLLWASSPRSPSFPRRPRQPRRTRL